MLTRSYSTNAVNAMLRASFNDPSMDVSGHVKSRRNYAFLSDEAVVVFIRSRSEKGAYSCILGVLPDSQRKGIGSNVLNEGIGWMFANTKASTIRGMIDPKVKSIRKITSRICVHNMDRRALGGQTAVHCTRENFAAMFPGGSDV